MENKKQKLNQEDIMELLDKLYGCSLTGNVINLRDFSFSSN